VNWNLQSGAKIIEASGVQSEAGSTEAVKGLQTSDFRLRLQTLRIKISNRRVTQTQNKKV
jgi:hypothetical protein